MAPDGGALLAVRCPLSQDSDRSDFGESLGCELLIPAGVAEGGVPGGPCLRGNVVRVVVEVAGEPVAKLASLLKAGGTIVSYTARNRQPVSIPLVDLIFRELSVHGYWLNRWLVTTPRETVVRNYRELAALVGTGTLAAPVEATYRLADYREAIGHAAQNDRHGKVLFTF